jgi:RNA polymerase sigma factor (sigma-70 family)
LQTSIDEPPAPVQCEQAADDRVKSWSFAIRKGDARAFAEFYESWFDRCVDLVQSKTKRDEEFALDVVQDVMMKVAVSMPVLKCHADLERWMMRVAYTTAIDHLRRGKRRALRESQAVRDEIEGADPDLVAQLEIALTKLPPLERNLILARFARGFSLKNIGDIFSTTPDAAHGKIRRILGTLRRFMQGTQL